MASKNERLANELLLELMRASLAYLNSSISAEGYLSRLRIIFRAANL